MVRVISVKDVGDGAYQYSVHADEWYGGPSNHYCTATKKKTSGIPLIAKKIQPPKRVTIGKQIN